MATKEAIMMRIEAAHERIKNALAQLQAESGAQISEIVLTEKDSLSRQAELSELLALNLEALCKVILPELDVDDGLPFDELTDEDEDIRPITMEEIANTKLEDEEEEDGKPNHRASSRQAGKSAEKPKKRS